MNKELITKIAKKVIIVGGAVAAGYVANRLIRGRDMNEEAIEIEVTEQELIKEE